MQKDSEAKHRLYLNINDGWLISSAPEPAEWLLTFWSGIFLALKMSTEEKKDATKLFSKPLSHEVRGAVMNQT